jgi:hypothetical protein
MTRRTRHGFFPFPDSFRFRQNGKARRSGAKLPPLSCGALISVKRMRLTACWPDGPAHHPRGRTPGLRQARGGRHGCHSSILEHSLAPSRVEGVDLTIGGLKVGRDAGVSHQHDLFSENSSYPRAIETRVSGLSSGRLHGWVSRRNWNQSAGLAKTTVYRRVKLWGDHADRSSGSGDQPGQGWALTNSYSGNSSGCFRTAPRLSAGPKPTNLSTRLARQIGDQW